jgi:tetratricopeptide (TPR) repeat protein
MKIGTIFVVLATFMLTAAIPVRAQRLSREQQTKVQNAFNQGAELMGRRKYAEALEQFHEALAIIPDEPAILYNAGLAAYLARDYAAAVESWKRQKTKDETNGMLRSKLIQAYQGMGNLKERDAERAALIELWKSGKDPELKGRTEFCRDQFEVIGRKVMVFELFELKGDQALRYVFSILNAAEDAEEFRMSLGSYDATNAAWRATANPKPGPSERVFHLDGDFSWGHATYSMYSPEPSYDDIRAEVIRILEQKDGPIRR